MNSATFADVVDVEAAEAPAVSVPALNASRTAIAVATPADLLRIAVENGADLDRLEKLMQLQERWEAHEARKAFVTAMAAFKREPIEIYKRKQVGYKTKEGDFVGYKHAELSDVTDAIAPVMARHGLSFDWDIHQASGSITVDCIVTHVLGHSKKVTMTGAPDTSGKKNLIQQAASTITYLQRYTLLAVTGMSTKDEDDDGAGGADEQSEDTAQAQRANERPAARAAQSQSAPYDQKKFDANKDQWREFVKSGRKTPAQMIKFIESKGAKLTEDQQLTIDSWAHED
ncbi:ERF family protein [Paraburkholderia caballeronis]|uniref:ERF superfamily protein n=1 Tax=Paraburkholderia caballeronis TaxID=416943 RepID=A0A1H7TXS2_9BURK|nr:ERF family protein [Paraburkholderia caballeronis]PXW23379.1 ERF superfamily protein [Paraburkholderia caballeronis]PXW98372.1 ERF superfamily protein [Paraburkholderia caballeronis]RAJ95102.1 ERF superfamily protein [Paraburkholderia caballeronis]SEC57044.1 ERF superfamily protein [Paraburkholderia caballeronis]SEL89463.1 ERF superfamily protein [Paraburkholderia caballeronis]